MPNLVFPGQMLADKPVRMGYAYVEGGKTYSSVLAMKSEEGKLIPLQGPYMPIEGDYVVGVVTVVKFAGYDVWLNTPYPGFLSSRDCADSFNIGDALSAKIRSVDEVKSITLEEPRLLRGGSVVRFSPVKIPRLIGKKNSMLDLIQSRTGCQIIVGKNGHVFIGPGKTVLALSVIRMIEREAHISGLTNRVEDYLSRQQ